MRNDAVGSGWLPRWPRPPVRARPCSALRRCPSGHRGSRGTLSAPTGDGRGCEIFRCEAGLLDDLPNAFAEVVGELLGSTWPNLLTLVSTGSVVTLRVCHRPTTQITRPATVPSDTGSTCCPATHPPSLGQSVGAQGTDQAGQQHLLRDHVILARQHLVGGAGDRGGHRTRHTMELARTVLTGDDVDRDGDLGGELQRRRLRSQVHVVGAGWGPALASDASPASRAAEQRRAAACRCRSENAGGRARVARGPATGPPRRAGRRTSPPRCRRPPTTRRRALRAAPDRPDGVRRARASTAPEECP